MQRGGICPVCEIPHDAQDGNGPVELAPAVAPSLLGSLWQSGRLGVLVSLLSFALASVVPLAYVRALSGQGPRTALTAVAMIEGVRILLGAQTLTFKSMIVVAIPGAALGMASFLWSRRTRGVMLASRPLVLVVAVMPGVAAALPLLNLGKVFVLTYSLGPAAALVALGVVAGVIGALKFGNGVAEEKPRSRHAGDDEE